MKLLFVSNLFPDQKEPWRGLDNVTLLHALRRLDKSLDIKVLAFRPLLKPPMLLENKSRPEDQDLKPIYFSSAYVPKLGGMNHLFFEWSLKRASRTLKGFRPDVVLAPWLFPDACGVATVFRSTRVVAVAQGSDVHQYIQMPMRRRAILTLCRQASKTVTRSRDLLNRLVAAGAHHDRVTTIYNGVDADVFQPGPLSATRQELGIPIEERHLLFVGNFLPVKGLDLLVSAVALVAKRHPTVSLTLIGTGPLESEIRDLAMKLGIANRLRFVGRRSPIEVAKWMKAADVVCLSSHNEGVPNVILEAISCDRPIVSTDVGGISEVLGSILPEFFLVGSRDVEAYAQGLETALTMPIETGQLQRSARQYSWANCARRYLELMK